MRGALARAVTVLVLAAGLGGCGSGTQLLLRSRSHPGPTRPAPRPVASAQSIYLAQLGAAQSQLATAEQEIPTNPRTPAALARAVGMLAAAMHGLGDRLAAIKPPVIVVGRHAQLVAIIQAYDAKLREAALIAGAADGQRRAGALLISATAQASRSFTATLAAIDSTLASSPS